MGFSTHAASPQTLVVTATDEDLALIYSSVQGVCGNTHPLTRELSGCLDANIAWTGVLDADGAARLAGRLTGAQLRWHANALQLAACRMRGEQLQQQLARLRADADRVVAELDA